MMGLPHTPTQDELDHIFSEFPQDAPLVIPAWAQEVIERVVTNTAQGPAIAALSVEERITALVFSTAYASFTLGAFAAEHGWDTTPRPYVPGEE